MTLKLESPAFETNGVIPRLYTGDGADRSPPLRWWDPPRGTLAYALALEDPDAPGGTFRHWLIVDIPGDWADLPEGYPGPRGPAGAREFRNGFGHEGYGGPLPPHGHGVHHYIFTLFALPVPHADDLPPEDARGIVRRLNEIAIERATLIGTYER